MRALADATHVSCLGRARGLHELRSERSHHCGNHQCRAGGIRPLHESAIRFESRLRDVGRQRVDLELRRIFQKLLIRSGTSGHDPRRDHSRSGDLSSAHTGTSVPAHRSRAHPAVDLRILRAPYRPARQSDFYALLHEGRATGRGSWLVVRRRAAVQSLSRIIYFPHASAADPAAGARIPCAADPAGAVARPLVLNPHTVALWNQ